MDGRDGPVRRGGPVGQPPVAPLVSLEHVRVLLHGTPILQDVDATMQPGEFVALLGPNGAGKTTLLRAITGLQPLTGGRILVANHPAGRGDPCIGYAPQRRALDPDLPLRGSELVALGLDGHLWGWTRRTAAIREQVRLALNAVGAEIYADAPVGRLSGGEQQRLLLAQALVSNPRLLLLDEPLASLDLRHQQELVELIARVSKERQTAVLLVAHDVNPLLPFVDRVWYLAGGRAAAGTPDEVIRPEVLSALYGSPIDVFRAGRRVFVAAGDGRG